MKLFNAIAAFVYLANPSYALLKTDEDKFHLSDKFVGNSMWIFGQSGVSVYSPDGSERKNYIAPEYICDKEPAYTGTGFHIPCRFYDIVSDGKKYVWAAVARGINKIDVFDINTGAVVGNFETCFSPNTLEYHPLRDEIWVRCFDVNENVTNASNLDVFSASSPSVDIQTDFLLRDDAKMEGISSRGHTIVHSSLGDVGFLTDRNLPHLFKVDLSNKSILKKYEMPDSVHGLYEAAYSPINKHLYVRTQLCCTCGFEGADKASCGRSPGTNVTVTTGPFAGQSNITGVCGSSCEGINTIDTIGVYEFDTTSETVLGTHFMDEGIVGDPNTSPDGEYIVLMGPNGGRSVRILRARMPGTRSTFFADVMLDGFTSEADTDVYEGKPMFKDFAFVKRNGMTKFVIASGSDHKIAIVDISRGPDNIQTSYVTFNEDEFEDPGAARRPHGVYRQCEWAEDTDYVWVNDHSLEEVYVIDVMNEVLVNTLQQVHTYRMLSVQNYERVRQYNLQKEMVDEALAAVSMDSSVNNAPIKSTENTVIAKDSSSGIAVAALAVGCLALIVGVANIALMLKMKNGQPVTRNVEENSINSFN